MKPLNENKMTAVEFLESRIKVLIPDDIGSQLMFKSNIKKANKMFEQQIIDACYEGMQAQGFDPNKGRCEQYYNSKYGK